MTIRVNMLRHVPVAVTILFFATPAWAQKVTVVPDLTGQQVLAQMANAGNTRAVGEAIALATAAEIATEPFGTSSGGFIFKLDPSTGLLARTTTTFGPSFTERALTSGEGQVSIGATFSSSTFDQLSGFSLSALPLGSTVATSASASRTSTANLALSARTVAISGTVGVTENMDVAVVVPMVSMKVAGTSSIVDGTGVVTRLAQTDGLFSGIGDVAALAKYRVFKFKGGDMPDPGGIALLVDMRLPTGSRDNLRGLGVTRTLLSVVASGGRGPFRPHGSAGFEYWNKGVGVAGNPGQTISLRHQVQYNGGVEVEAAPKVTLLVDFIGQQILGGGQIGLVTDTPLANPSGITSTQSMVALSQGINKMLLVPGLKVNLKGKLLLSLSAIVTLKNDGLHSKVTPVAGINLTM